MPRHLPRIAHRASRTPSATSRKVLPMKPHGSFPFATRAAVAQNSDCPRLVAHGAIPLAKWSASPAAALAALIRVPASRSPLSVHVAGHSPGRPDGICRVRLDSARYQSVPVANLDLTPSRAYISPWRPELDTQHGPLPLNKGAGFRVFKTATLRRTVHFPVCVKTLH